MRIIPALAGNTICRTNSVCSTTDHPRSRGEYKVDREVKEVREGSSPLSRGIPPSQPELGDQQRIIPALAGNTNNLSGKRASGKDHPRSRGEYSKWIQIGMAVAGSSPLSRGILPSRSGPPVEGGIIPALAGNTSSCPDYGVVTGDHPRSRGEYFVAVGCCVSPLGSSPLSRGIPRTDTMDHATIRIIPALAGNTPADPAAQRLHGDHPRSRGEYINTLRANGSFDGSSPLSRGIQRSRILPRPMRGIIPALAGNT